MGDKSKWMLVPSPSLLAFMRLWGAEAASIPDTSEQQFAVWQGNIYQGVLGIASRSGLEQSSAFSKQEGGLLLPTAETITALRTGLKPNGLAVDLAGKARPEQGSVGAFQYDTKLYGAKPLGAGDVGLYNDEYRKVEGSYQR